MPLLTIRRVDAILGLIRANLPTSVETDGDFEYWNVIAPAMVSIVADLFEGMMVCAPPRGRLRADVLARSLSEHAIAFAWLAGLGGEPSPTGSAACSSMSSKSATAPRTSWKRRSPAARHTATCSTRRRALEAPYRKRCSTARPVIASKNSKLDRRVDQTFTQRLRHGIRGRHVLDAQDRTRRSKSLRADLLHALFGIELFHPSFYLGGRPDDVGERRGKVAVGAPEGLGESDAPYGPAYLALVNTLIVATTALGWPSPGPIQALFIDSGRFVAVSAAPGSHAVDR